ncbi:hypothetical protein BD770DRAFT_383923 [Pilaira anomala]|nr:hypothetical protein BD770DRAFT_383923 [Pilaira anomala]
MGCWKKLYNGFILQRMWPLLTNENLDETAIEIMAVLGVLGLSNDPTKPDKPGVQQIFDLMLRVYNVGDVISKIQVTALQGATMLSANDHTRIKKLKSCID